MSVIICSPPATWIHRPDTACPFCDYTVGLVGMSQDYYDTIWVCLACGEEWTNEGYQRPFARGWRWRNVRGVLSHVEGARIVREPVDSGSVQPTGVADAG